MLNILYCIKNIKCICGVQLNSTTQPVMPPEFLKTGERKEIMFPDSLCISCYVRDTA